MHPRLIASVGTVALAATALLACDDAGPPVPTPEPPPGPSSPAPPPPGAAFDYQLGGDYPPAAGVDVVVRDWFAGTALREGYSVCYVNAFQTQPDTPGGERPDETSSWPAEVVLDDLGDDPGWPGEYLVDISTPERRQVAAAWVEPMIDTCADQGFDAVELDNLDSWTRFDDTPRAGSVPFGPEDATEFAALLTAHAHRRGLAVAQKNATELLPARAAVGFDFAVVEECGEWDECTDVADAYGPHLLAVEYSGRGLAAACDALGDGASVVRRDLDLRTPDERGHVFATCADA